MKKPAVLGLMIIALFIIFDFPQAYGETTNSEVILAYRDQLLNADWMDESIVETTDENEWYDNWYSVLNNESGFTGRFAVIDMNADGTLEVYVEFRTAKDPTDAVWAVLYNADGMKVYRNDHTREILSAINPRKGRLLFERTRGKGIDTVYTFDAADGIELEDTWFGPYVVERSGEETLNNIEDKYYADMFAPHLVELNSRNIDRYLSGNGKPTQYDSWGEAYFDFLLGDSMEIGDYGEHILGTDYHVFSLTGCDTSLHDANFALVDMSGDDIPELLVYNQRKNEQETIDGEEPQNVCVYAYEDGHIVHLCHVGLSGGGDICLQNFASSNSAAYPGIFAMRWYESESIGMYYSIKNGALISQMIFKDEYKMVKETGHMVAENQFMSEDTDLIQCYYKASPIIFYSLTGHWAVG